MILLSSRSLQGRLWFTVVSRFHVLKSHYLLQGWMSRHSCNDASKPYESLSSSWQPAHLVCCAGAGQVQRADPVRHVQPGRVHLRVRGLLRLVARLRGLQPGHAQPAPHPAARAAGRRGQEPPAPEQPPLSAARGARCRGRSLRLNITECHARSALLRSAHAPVRAMRGSAWCAFCQRQPAPASTTSCCARRRASRSRAARARAAAAEAEGRAARGCMMPGASFAADQSDAGVSVERVWGRPL